MPCSTSSRARASLWPWLAAAICAALLFALESDYGLDLADEGFLWHGVARTAAGEIPERDFQAAYEPGRFYWGALFARALGPGLHSLRAANASFGALGLALGLCAARRGISRRLPLLALAALLALWMGPRHKLFEPAVALAAALSFTRLLEQPDLRRHAAAGATVGLALCIGRNHALYCALALALCAAWLWRQARRPPRARALLACTAGCLAGASPLLLLALAAPGYAQAFMANLLFYAEHGANHPLPIPWPWSASALQGAPGISLGFALEAALPIALCASLWRRAAACPARAAAFASASVALAYSHHAFARADAAHLAQALPPLLLATALWPAATARPSLAPALLGAVAGLTLLAVTELRPALGLRLAPSALSALEVSGRQLWLPSEQAQELASLRRAIEASVPASARLLAAPALPGLHPWLGRAAAGWRSYFLWPASPSEETRMLDELARPGPCYALLQEGAPFGIESLRFERSHPTVASALERDFEPVAAPDLPPGYRLRLRRSELPSRRDGAALQIPSF